MKKATLITLLAVAIGQGVFGQTKPRYFEYTTYFTLTNGCESSSKGTVDTYNGHAIGFDDIKKLTAKWVWPNKIKSMSLGEVKEIKKSEMLAKSERFKCPEPIKWLFSDTTKTTSTRLYTGSPIVGFTSMQPSSIVWHWGDNKMPMTWLPKPNITNIDSIEIYVSKRLTYWLNDSTLIIKKP